MDTQAATDYILSRLERELPDTLQYHNAAHTRRVMEAAAEFAAAEGINDPGELAMLRTAAAYHDCGFLERYQDNEELGRKIATRELPSFDYSPAEIARVGGMIMATRMPQSPKNLLERVLCDADLGYLGTPEHGEIADRLHRELRGFGVEMDEEAWLRRQIDFLDSHHFHTAAARELRGGGKRAIARKLRAKLAGISSKT